MFGRNSDLEQTFFFFFSDKHTVLCGASGCPRVHPPPAMATAADGEGWGPPAPAMADGHLCSLSCSWPSFSQWLGLPQWREDRSCADVSSDHPLCLRDRELFYLFIDIGIAMVADSLA